MKERAKSALTRRGSLVSCGGSNKGVRWEDENTRGDGGEETRGDGGEETRGVDGASDLDFTTDYDEGVKISQAEFSTHAPSKHCNEAPESLRPTAWNPGIPDWGLEKQLPPRIPEETTPEAGIPAFQRPGSAGMPFGMLAMEREATLPVEVHTAYQLPEELVDRLEADLASDEASS